MNDDSFQNSEYPRICVVWCLGVVTICWNSEFFRGKTSTRMYIVYELGWHTLQTGVFNLDWTEKYMYFLKFPIGKTISFQEFPHHFCFLNHFAPRTPSRAEWGCPRGIVGRQYGPRGALLTDNTAIIASWLSIKANLFLCGLIDLLGCDHWREILAMKGLLLCGNPPIHTEQ